MLQAEAASALHAAANSDGPLPVEAIEFMLENLHRMPMEEKMALLEELETLERKQLIKRARNDFLAFCHLVYTDFKEGPHHRHLRPLLHQIKEGTQLRLTVSMPPRFGKSISIAYLFVAWYLGHHPTHHIMMITHTASLSAAFGRDVRNLIGTPVYREVFPDTVVSTDKSAADNWTTTLGGKYLAIGIGANVAGHGAHLLVADDLVSEQAVLAGNPDTAFQTAWEYMQVGPLQRLMPGGRIVMIGCMTAETGVLMADGTEKELQHIKVGDQIATYDNGVIGTSKVTNWIKHRDDTVYKITTTSGKIVRANKRHPFLVDRNGDRTWVRVRDLKVGDCLVEAVQPTGAAAPTRHAGCAQSVTSDCFEQKGVSAPSEATGTGVNGKVSSVLLTDVATPSARKGFATVATESSLGDQASTDSPKSKSAPAISSIGTAFLRRFMTACLKLRGAAAQFAGSRQQERTPERDSSQSCTSTTAMTPAESVDCCATTATWPSDTQKLKSGCAPLPSTYGVTTAAIVEIVEDGFEPVFDMEVERTENFIANGVVSHNTRWGKKDPIGRALSWAQENPESIPWHEVRFPAVMKVQRDGEEVELSLWPEQWPLEQLKAKRAGMQPQFWAAQYQQEPTSEEGALLKREWWHIWQPDRPPKCDFVVQTWDTAHETKTTNDYTACTTWGVWFDESDGKNKLILLNAFKVRVEFPQLKQRVLAEYKEWQPECLLIEKKAAGAPLIQELRQMNIVVQEYTPSRGSVAVSNDKRARVNAVSDILFSGLVYAPDTRWAHEVINECAEFPAGEHDDYVDCVAMAWSRFRKGGFITLDTDAQDDDNLWRPPRKAAYY